VCVCVGGGVLLLCGVGIREEAAASLTCWSTSGLERLFTDLYHECWCGCCGG